MTATPNASRQACASQSQSTARTQVNLYDASTGKATADLTSAYMTAIVSRAVPHLTLPAIAAGSASGRIHIYQ